MKIALVTQEYFPEKARGGIGTQTYMKAHGLAALGHHVFIISRSIDETRYERIEGNIIEICIPGMEKQLPEMTDIVQWLTHSVSVTVEIEALNNRVGIDIIDFPEWAAEGYTYLLNRTRWNTIPTVIQLHGPIVMLAHTIGWPEMDSAFYKIGSKMEATCIQSADGIYSSSECSANWIRSHYDPKITDIPVIHVGIDTKTFFPQPVSKHDRPTILFTGKIVRNKGVEELVEAACRLSHEFTDLNLRMAGRGEENFIDYLKKKAETLGNPDLLEFPGFITRKNLPAELSKAHVFAAPSYYEGGPGFVYLEAMACGLPVIACSGSGIDEIIQNGKNGLLVPPRNAIAIEEALRMILNDRAMAERLGGNALKYVLDEADNQHCIKKLEAFYLSVLKKTCNILV